MQLAALSELRDIFLGRAEILPDFGWGGIGGGIARRICCHYGAFVLLLCLLPWVSLCLLEQLLNWDLINTQSDWKGPSPSIWMPQGKTWEPDPLSHSWRVCLPGCSQAPLLSAIASPHLPRRWEPPAPLPALAGTATKGKAPGTRETDTCFYWVYGFVCHCCRCCCLFALLYIYVLAKNCYSFSHTFA